jgi:hypothetical protein
MDTFKPTIKPDPTKALLRDIREADRRAAEAIGTAITAMLSNIRMRWLLLTTQGAVGPTDVEKALEVVDYERGLLGPDTEAGTWFAQRRRVIATGLTQGDEPPTPEITLTLLQGGLIDEPQGEE